LFCGSDTEIRIPHKIDRLQFFDPRIDLEPKSGLAPSNANLFNFFESLVEAIAVSLSLSFLVLLGTVQNIHFCLTRGSIVTPTQLHSVKVRKHIVFLSKIR
jgi:hypothetical protein